MMVISEGFKYKVDCKVTGIALCACKEKFSGLLRDKANVKNFPLFARMISFIELMGRCSRREITRCEGRTIYLLTVNRIGAVIIFLPSLSRTIMLSNIISSPG